MPDSSQVLTHELLVCPWAGGLWPCSCYHWLVEQTIGCEALEMMLALASLSISLQYDVLCTSGRS